MLELKPARILASVILLALAGAPAIARSPGAGTAATALTQASVERPKPPTGVNEVTVPLKARTLAIVLSGDGGWWGDLDRKLAERMGDAGYAVVGLDTNKWFHVRRTPDEISTELTNLIRDYSARTGASEVVLVGYSFGADVLPLAINRFRPAIARRISAIVLIAPSRGVDPRVTLLERTGMQKPSIELAPEFTRLPVKKLLCIYGADQADESGCTTAQLQISKVVMLPGGHHFDGILDHLAQPVLDTLAEWAPAK